MIADKVQIDAAGVIDTGGQALNGIPQNAPDSPAAGKLCIFKFFSESFKSFLSHFKVFSHLK